MADGEGVGEEGVVPGQDSVLGSLVVAGICSHHPCAWSLWVFVCINVGLGSEPEARVRSGGNDCGACIFCAAWLCDQVLPCVVA